MGSGVIEEVVASFALVSVAVTTTAADKVDIVVEPVDISSELVSASAINSKPEDQGSDTGVGLPGIKDALGGGMT